MGYLFHGRWSSLLNGIGFFSVGPIHPVTLEDLSSSNALDLGAFFS